VIGTELVTEFVQTVLLTGRLTDESPLSAFIIAKPEHGKTSICLETPFSNAVDLTDTTGRGLQEILKYKAEVSHIILNDLTIISAHSKTVRSYLISMINAMTEEGIRSVAFPGQVEIFQNGKRGIIGCVTPALISDQRTWFNKIGLSTRVLPFHYSYSEQLIIRIKATIDNEQPQNSSNKVLKIPAIPIKVTIGEKETQIIRKLSDEKQIQLEDDTGIRRLKQFRRLTKAHALMRTWKDAKVTDEDIQFLRRIYNYIDYKRGCLL